MSHLKSEHSSPALSLATKCVHAGSQPEKLTGAVSTPIFQTSTYVQNGPGNHRGYEYSRTHNPTRDALEEKLAAVENAKHAISFASGCAATTAILMLLKAGDHVISTHDVYGGTHRLFKQVFNNFNLSFDFEDLSDFNNLNAFINSHKGESLKMVWVESPTNPMLGLVDIKNLAKICQANNILLIIDNTFATPILQNPLDLGADIVVHSTSKYINGHSDVVGGILATNNSELNDKLRFIMNSTGGMPGPMDAYLTQRGLKTLNLRVKQQVKNSQKIAEFLENNYLNNKNPKISKIYYPGLKSHPQYELAQEQMRGPGAMISFVLSGGLEASNILLKNTKLFACAESLGGVESLIEHPAIMTHASVPKAHREELGIEDGLIRLSVGIEDADDLIADLKQALDLI